MTRQLQKAAVRLLSEQTCRRFYPVQISSRMLCAGFPQGGVDSCSVSPGPARATRGPGPAQPPAREGSRCHEAHHPGATLRCRLLQRIKQGAFLDLEEFPLHNRLLGTHRIPPLGLNGRAGTGCSGRPHSTPRPRGGCPSVSATFALSPFSR